MGLFSRALPVLVSQASAANGVSRQSRKVSCGRADRGQTGLLSSRRGGKAVLLVTERKNTYKAYHAHILDLYAGAEMLLGKLKRLSPCFPLTKAWMCGGLCCENTPCPSWLARRHCAVIQNNKCRLLLPHTAPQQTRRSGRIKKKKKKSSLS